MLPIKAIIMYEKAKEMNITPETFFGALLNAEIPEEKWVNMLLLKINTFIKRTEKLATPILSRMGGKFTDYIQEKFDEKYKPRTNFPIPEDHDTFLKEYESILNVSDIAISKYFENIFNSEDLEDAEDFARLDFTVKFKDGETLSAIFDDNNISIKKLEKINEYFKPAKFGNNRIYTNIVAFIMYTSTLDNLENSNYLEQIEMMDIAELNVKGYVLSLAAGIIGKYLEDNTKDLFKNFF